MIEKVPKVTTLYETKHQPHGVLEKQNIVALLSCEVESISAAYGTS